MKLYSAWTLALLEASTTETAARTATATAAAAATETRASASVTQIAAAHPKTGIT